MNDLKANILFDNDILKSKNIVFHVKKEKLIINSCENFSVSLNVVVKNDVRIKRTVRAQVNVTIFTHSCSVISIKLREFKLSNRDMLFNSNYINRLKKMKYSLI